MRLIGTVARLVAVVTVLFALSGTRFGAYAQETDETAVTDEAVEAPAATYYVGVSCWPVGDGSLSGCSFSASSSDGSAIEALWVPAWIVCSEVVDSGGAEWTGDGYHVYGGSLSLTLAGSVSAVGGGSYVVRANGTPVDAPGDALACSPAPEPVVDDGAVEAPDPGADETPDDGNGTGAEDGSGDEAPVEEAPVEEAPDGGAIDGAPPEAETGGNATGEDGATDGDVTGEPPVATDDSAPAVVGDGTVGSSPGVTEEPADEIEAQEVQAAETVDITVLVYQCATDPGVDDPANVCTEDTSIALSATDDGTDVGAPGDCGGDRCFTATVGQTFIVTEDVPDTHDPIGDASETIDSVSGAATIVFVNVAKVQEDSQLGRIQIILGRCPSTEDKETKFTVIPPDSFQARVEESCGPVPGAFLTITGGDIGEGGVQVVTDEDGEWQGYLPPGDDYHVIGAAGTSPALPVVADELTALVIIDYSQGEGASLTITRTVCTTGEANGSELEISTDEPNTGGEGCGPANGQFLLEDDAEITAQDSTTFSLGNDGIETKWLPAGNYVLTDLSSGESEAFQIVDGVDKFAAARTVTLVGRLVVRHYYCSDPASNDETDATYFRNTCDDPSTTQITLTDADGDAIETRSGKTFTWNPINAGSYGIDGDDYCANLNSYADASDGFVVEPNVTTRIYLYTCAAPNTGGDDDADDDDGDDDANGDDDDDDGDDDGNADDDDGDDDAADDDDNGNTDEDDEDEEEVGGVTTLPQTGITGSSDHGNGVDELALLALALPALLAAAALNRRRTI